MSANSKLSERQLINELQTRGVRLTDPAAGAPSRRGGAGPSDHKAVEIGGKVVMIPVHTAGAGNSPYRLDGARVSRDGQEIARMAFTDTPRFYDLKTAEGIPYSHIATLHGKDVLATTVLQTCIRYNNRKISCQFCAIGQSLDEGRTIAHKTPQQLAEVARAAVELDGVKHMVMTTGTPNLQDRGARVLCDSAEAVTAAVDLPIQGQCEPPDDRAWFRRLRDSGIQSLGMHLEIATPALRETLMPSKSSITVEHYLEAFADAVDVFGRGQVSTYLLAGLGDTVDTTLALCERLVALGVYPFVVPFVPISGTPLAHHPAPTAAHMKRILEPLGTLLRKAELRSTEIKAGCGRCGACSSLSAFEEEAAS
ncbi:Radical SAM domain protein [Alloalcanivorax dieselolei B5]|uniref:Radical SAM domain protein n=1 Tax=Alcanivorax dieselolei (strain DSM 16502 / CGMCC 1.3690 / MCCC 1A00001 / B-5) TaxID=930169 RepID=K0CHF6_ALCDB|nr:MSMEG_0568 family radical SAM protein [Alloalcanivorax dieselolei]AFT71167.1 Radical SAM domain protein [Alloalcanivorax dieselolei B5]GGJ93628.1 radical SAM protein [Alloalcanivorax dieselolei]